MIGSPFDVEGVVNVSLYNSKVHQPLLAYAKVELSKLEKTFRPSNYDKMEIDNMSYASMAPDKTKYTEYYSFLNSSGYRRIIGVSLTLRDRPIEGEPTYEIVEGPFVVKMPSRADKE
jgi:hypothetical protein